MKNRSQIKLLLSPVASTESVRQHHSCWIERTPRLQSNYSKWHSDAEQTINRLGRLDLMVNKLASQRLFS